MEESRTRAVGRRRRAPRKVSATNTGGSSPSSRESGEVVAEEAKQESGALKAQPAVIKPRDHTLDQIADAELREIVRERLAKRPKSNIHGILASLRTTQKKKGGDKEAAKELSFKARQAFKDLRKLRRAAVAEAGKQSNSAISTPTSAGPRASAADADSSSDEDASVGDPPGGSPKVHMTEASDSERHSDAASVGNAPVVTENAPSLPPTSNGAQNVDTSTLPPSYTTVHARTAPTPGQVQLCDVDAAEQALQKRYWSLTDPAAVVRCLSCGQTGHYSAICVARTCTHCAARDQHLSDACPSIAKCARCRTRGHASRDCDRVMTVAPGAHGDACDVCLGRGHVEEQCPCLGLLYRPDAATTRRIPRRQMVVACYRCASDQHWGDDCPMHKVYLERDGGGARVWSREYADLFIVEDDETRAPVKTSNGDAQHHMMAQLGDWR